jgi:RNA polymerase sigma-70 factor, ECF subfamily
MGSRSPTDDAPEAHADDVVLAAACLAGLPGAAETLERRLRADIERAIARVESRAERRRELAQEVLVSLLIGDRGSGPRLRDYSGRGSLNAWVRMVAVRRALNASRDASRHARIEARLLRTTVQDSLDPELAVLKAEHAEDFALAFREALVGLPAAERMLLRLHYGEGVPLDGIAALHGWSKATASRRLGAARAALLAQATRCLQARLKLTVSELASLMRVMRSGLEVRLHGVLRSGAL